MANTSTIPIASSASGSIANPEFTETGKITNRSVATPTAALEFCKVLEKDNQTRNLKATKVQQKYDGVEPYSAQKLQDQGQAWKPNVNSGFMAGIIDRIIPGYIDAATQPRFLTHSRLPDYFPDADKKSTKFQKVITTTIRGWRGWKDVIATLVQEDVLQGYVAVGFADGFEWRPKVYRMDNFMIPDGTLTDKGTLQAICLRRPLLLHELHNFIQDPEAADSVGWNVENVRKSLAGATTHNPILDGSVNYRAYEDVLREGSLAASYINGAKVVEIYDLFVRETATGKVSHWMLDRMMGHELYVKFDEFESVDDVVTIFTLQTGTGTVYSSKGAGRILYNAHVLADRSRNEKFAQTFMAGMLIVKGDAKSRDKSSINMSSPYLFVSKDCEIVANPTAANVLQSGFTELDRLLQAYAEQSVGAFIPTTYMPGGQGTQNATEAMIIAAKEKAYQEGSIGRFTGYLYDLVASIQRRMVSADNISEAQRRLNLESTGIRLIPQKVYDFLEKIGKNQGVAPVKESILFDEEAVAACKELLQGGLSAEELFLLAQSSADSAEPDTDESQKAEFTQVAQQYAGSPLINQTEMLRRSLTYRIGAEAADALIVDTDPTAIQHARAQEQECTSMIVMRQPQQVDPKDSHRIHLEVLKQLIPLAIQSQDVPTRAALPLALQHFQDHLNAMSASGVKPHDMAPDVQFLKAMSHAAEKLPAPTGVNGQVPPAPTPQQQIAMLEIEDKQTKIDERKQKMQLDAAKTEHELHLSKLDGVKTAHSMALDHIHAVRELASPLPTPNNAQI